MFKLQIIYCFCFILTEGVIVHPYTDIVSVSSDGNKVQLELSSDMCVSHMSRIMRKPAFCICENKDAD